MCPSPVARVHVPAPPPLPEDRCPGVLRLHAAADGHLARVRLPGGIVRADGLRAVAVLAARGNGIVELTSRAGLQVRGLGAADAEWAAATLADAGLLPSPAHDRVRNVLAPALGGRATATVPVTDALVTAVDRELCADPDLARLPGRFLFLVDDASGTLDRATGDIALVAVDADAAGRWRLELAGRATTLVVHGVTPAAALAAAAARAFLTLEADAGRHWRLADVPDGPARLAAVLDGALADDAEPAPGGGAPDVGRAPQRDGRAAVTVLPPLGRVDAGVLLGLADLVGSADVRLSPARTLTFVDVDGAAVPGLTAALGRLGLVTAPGSGWPGLSACAGLGACASARLDVRAAATRRVPARRGIPGGAPEHWAACGRGCGRPAGSALLAIADDDGGLTLTSPDGVPTHAADVDAALAWLGEGPSV